MFQDFKKKKPLNTRKNTEKIKIRKRPKWELTKNKVR